MSTRKIGLALGSGSARGWAHIGVLEALAERGIRPDIVAGASVGALVAGAYASKQLDTLREWVEGLTRMEVWRLLDTTMRGGGVIRGNRLMNAIGERLEDPDIESLSIPFGAVAADLNSGQEVWLRQGPMLSAVRASSGLPGLFSPIWHQDRWLIDGGVVNPVPVSLCRALGADYVISVNLNSHLNKRSFPPQDEQETAPVEELAEDDDDTSGSWTSSEKWTTLVDGLIESMKSRGDKTPGMFDVVAASINIMQDRITRSRMVGDPPDVQINPRLGHLQMMDFHRGEEAIAAGSQAVERISEDLAPLR